MSNPLDDVTLHTGDVVARATVTSVFVKLRQVARKPMVFIDLVDRLHNADHPLAEDTVKALPASWTLDASMSKETLAVIRASVVGTTDDMDLRIVNPITGR